MDIELLLTRIALYGFFLGLIGLYIYAEFSPTSLEIEPNSKQQAMLAKVSHISHSDLTSTVTVQIPKKIITFDPNLDVKVNDTVFIDAQQTDDGTLFATTIIVHD